MKINRKNDIPLAVEKLRFMSWRRGSEAPTAAALSSECIGGWTRSLPLYATWLLALSLSSFGMDKARAVSASAARDALARQVTRPVRWRESLELLAAEGADTFVEVGPGRVLSGLVKRTLGRDVGIYAVDELEEIDAVVAALG